MAQQSTGQLDTVMQETRLFPPTKEASARAHIKSMDAYQKLWDEAAADPPAFWAKLAKTELHWFEPFKKALEWNEPFAEWFAGGKTNASYNCLDRHLAAGHGDRVAYHWEGEPGDTRRSDLRPAPPRSVQVRQRAQEARRRPRRRRVHLHADHARAGHRHARLRPHRRHPLGDLRRLQRRSHRRPQ